MHLKWERCRECRIAIIESIQNARAFDGDPRRDVMPKKRNPFIFWRCELEGVCEDGNKIAHHRVSADCR